MPAVSNLIRQAFGWICLVFGTFWSVRAIALLVEVERYQTEVVGQSVYPYTQQVIDEMQSGFRVHLGIGLVVVLIAVLLLTRRSGASVSPVTIAMEMHRQRRRDSVIAGRERRQCQRMQKQQRRKREMTERAVRKAIAEDRRREAELELRSTVDAAVAADRMQRKGPSA